MLTYKNDKLTKSMKSTCHGNPLPPPYCPLPSTPLSSISYLFKLNLVISYSKHLYNQRQRASWRDISDTSPPNFVGKLIFIIDDGGP